MLDPAVQDRIKDRLGDAAQHQTGEDTHSPESHVDALWQNWLTLGAQLQEFGFAPRSMCDATNAIAEIREEVRAEDRGGVAG